MNQFIDLPLPAGNGPGVAVDVSQMGPEKTFVCEGNFPGAGISVEVSVDGGATFQAIHTFTRTKKLVRHLVCTHARVLVTNRSPNRPFVANIDVGSEVADNDFGNFVLPAGDGDGPPLDVSEFGNFTTFQVTGNFPKAGIHLMASEDGVDYKLCTSFSAGGVKSGNFVAKFMRVRVTGRSSHPFNVAVSIGASKAAVLTASSILTGDPVTVTGPTNAEGVSEELARGDHQHRLELQVQDEGILQGARPIIDFVGAGVGAVDDVGGDKVVVTIPGGGGNGAVVEVWSYQATTVQTSGLGWMDASGGSPVAAPMNGDYLCIFEGEGENQSANGVLEVGVGVNSTVAPFAESPRLSQGPSADTRAIMTSVRVPGLLAGDLIYPIFRKASGSGAVRLHRRRLTLIKVQ